VLLYVVRKINDIVDIAMAACTAQSLCVPKRRKSIATTKLLRDLFMGK